MKIIPYFFALYFLFSDCLLAESKCEAWVLQYVKERGIETKKDASDQFYSLTLAPNQTSCYSELQNKIAAFIPKESQRPTISLLIEEDSIEDKVSVGIVGGMGPVSDARILNLIVEQLKQKKLTCSCRIHLLSAPPPRSIFEIVSRGFSYFMNLYQFLSSPRHFIYLSSNTAHIYFHWINEMGNHNLIDLTHYVVDKVQRVIKNPYVLIIGTTAAKNANLYGKLFQEREIQYLYLSDEQQEVAQQEIDRVKSGHINESKLYGIISQVVVENPVNVILLACTELGMVLENRRKELNELGLIIIDSEQIFAEKISLDIEAYNRSG